MSQRLQLLVSLACSAVLFSAVAPSAGSKREYDHNPHIQ
jgi:hypothetical protein